MRWTYDGEADAAYLNLLGEQDDQGPVQCVSLDPERAGGMINFDYRDGKLVGIEVIDASRLLPESVIRSAERPVA